MRSHQICGGLGPPALRGGDPPARGAFPWGFQAGNPGGMMAIPPLSRELRGYRCGRKDITLAQAGITRRESVYSGGEQTPRPLHHRVPPDRGKPSGYLPVMGEPDPPTPPFFPFFRQGGGGMERVGASLPAWISHGGEEYIGTDRSSHFA